MASMYYLILKDFMSVNISFIMKLGTGLSIMISKRNPSLFTTFALLSCGYVMSSYKEIRSNVLHTLNRARFTVSVESFLSTGVMDAFENSQFERGKFKGKHFQFALENHRPIVLGTSLFISNMHIQNPFTEGIHTWFCFTIVEIGRPRFKDAFQDPNSYLTLEPIFEQERYIVTYQSKSDDILKAAFHAHVLLHIICSSNQNSPKSRIRDHDLSVVSPKFGDLKSHIAESYKMVLALYGPFKNKAKEQGWVMSKSLLNPGRAR
ncbi:hypothetical protein STAS_15490, partial [Striga asiatica]